jgi:hypothetical protein
MEITELENRLKKITEDINKETFIYDLLLAYDFPKATISRIKSGDLNISKKPNEILLKKKLLFKSIRNEDLHDVIDELSNDKQIAKHQPRFIIVTDFNLFLSLDTKTKDTLDIPIGELDKNTNFYFPWIGKEKTKIQNESLIDIKAATKMGQLYDSIIQENKHLISSKESRHELNIFFARLLFCLFSEDTGIFKDAIFINYLASQSSEDGSDLKICLQEIFSTLNTKDNSAKSKYLQDFPYVNGGLFKDDTEIPYFSRKSREIIIEAGKLDWGGINPDIFGSMVQAISDPKERANYGVHYTSVTNILKVINPLFMDELNGDFDHYETEKDLEKILDKIYHIRIFDPACGSGNFLIISYKQLCILEIKIFEELQSLNPNKWNIARSGIQLNQFYGITINDFDAEIAKLSLWLSEHQMNLQFKSVFGESRPSLPLTESGNIFHANSNRIDWNSVCPKSKDYKIYICGNPPYLGANKKDNEQKEDVEITLKNISKRGILDYICCWFLKASEYISGTQNEFAFVSTNSICQGSQVPIIWPSLLRLAQIRFAYTSFPWKNLASNNATVNCVIIGMMSRSIKTSKKFIFDGVTSTAVEYINPYLTSSKINVVEIEKSPLFNLPPIYSGSMPNDSGFFFFDKHERDAILSRDTRTLKFIKKTIMTDEYLNGIDRFCFWIEDVDLDEASDIKDIKLRIDKIKIHRLASPRKATNKLALKAHRFGEVRHRQGNAIFIPETTSESREYIPIGFITDDSIILKGGYAIYNSKPFIFALISSKMHMVWLRAICGRLETRLRYSTEICYNPFPIPELNNEQEEILLKDSFEILDIREKYSERKLSDLYSPSRMPDDLVSAHKKLDLHVEEMYSSKPFQNDIQRLDFLFKMYADKKNIRDIFDA